MLAGPRKNATGPNTGQESWFFAASWGMVIEMIHRPDVMPYQRDIAARLFKAPPVTAAPR